MHKYNYRYIGALLVTILFLSAAYGKSLVFPPYGHSYGIRKAMQIHLSIFLPFTRFKDPQGLATAKMISRDDPATENDDDEVVVYGVNSGRHQLIYNTSMWGLTAYGKRGSGKDQFKFPKGIACDPHGNVYVADAGNNRIVHLFNAKRKVHWVKAFNGKGSGNEGLKTPSQIGLDAKGYIYVTDTGSRRIVVFDSTGKILRIISGNDSCSFVDGPTTIAVADGKFCWSHFRNERVIFCADSNGRRLWKIDFKGRVQKVVKVPSKYSAHYGAVDYYHNFWVTDKKNHCILKFDHNLKLLDIFGSYGKDDNRFIEPRGIAIWKRYGQTFVAEKTGAQYYWVGTDIKKVGFWERENADIFFIKTDLTEYSYISLYYVKGFDQIELIRPRYTIPGERTLSFTNDRIKGLHGGSFLFSIEPTYSSYTYYHWDYPIVLYRDASSVPDRLPKGVLVKEKGFKGSKKSIKELISVWEKVKENK